MRYLSMAHMGQISVWICVRVHVCACVSQCVLDAEILSASAFFFFGLRHHGSIVLGFPANHMSGLLMFMPSYINQIGLRAKSDGINNPADSQKQHIIKKKKY